MAVLFQDIHDQRQTEQALAESEERYRSLVELSPEAIVVHSKGKLVYLNPAGVRQLGLERAEQALGLPIMYLLPPETRQLNLEIMNQVNQGNKSLPPLEQTILRPDGSAIEVEIIGAPVLFQGKPAFQLVVRNITVQKQAHQAIQESEQHLRALIEAASLGLHQYELLPDGRLIFCGANPSADRILGLDHQKLMGLAIEYAFPTLRRTEIPGLYRQVARDGEPYFCEQIAYQDQQIEGVFEIHAFQTGPSRMAVFFQDVTEKKRAELTLRESGERYQRLFENSPLGIFQASPEGKVLAVNPAFARMFGYDSTEEVLATSNNVATDIFFDPNRRAEITGMVAENHNLKSFENLYPRKDGSPFPSTLHLHPVKDAGNRLLYFEGFIEDITEKKQAEEKIRDLARFPEENPYPVARINREGVLLCANRAAIPMLASLGHQIGRTLPPTWWDYIKPVFESRQTKEVEFTFEARIFSLSLVPVLDEGYINIYGLDITERKQAELDLRRRIIEIEALHAVALAGTEATSTGELLERVAEIIREKLYLDHFGVSFLDDKNKMLTLHPSFVPVACQAVVRSL